MSVHHNVKVTHSRVEERFTLNKKNAAPNGMDYDPENDDFLFVDQGDGELITVKRTNGTLTEARFQAGAKLPSGVKRLIWNGRESIFISGTYGREISVIQGNQISTVDYTGIGTGIVDFANDLVHGTHTGFHGLEWDGKLLWAASPPWKTIFSLGLEETEAGIAFTHCSWFPLVSGNRPHGLAWANAEKTEIWCNDTTLGVVFRYRIDNGACLEILILPHDAPEAHGMTMVNGHLWYCEDKTARVCEIIPL